MARSLKSLLPQPSDIRDRTSSINYAIAASAAPYVEPSEPELDEMFTLLGMDRDNLRCAFCGQPTDKLGHLNALVKDTQPTGWGTTVGNLVPICPSCSSSKGNLPWINWLQRKKDDINWAGHTTVLETTRRLTLLEQRFSARQLDWNDVPPALKHEFNRLRMEVGRSLEQLHEVGQRIRECYKPKG